MKGDSFEPKDFMPFLDTPEKPKKTQTPQFIFNTISSILRQVKKDPN